MPTRRGEHVLVVAGVRLPPKQAWRARLRKFTVLATLFALFTRTSVAIPEWEDDDPVAWADDAHGGADWSDSGGDSGGDGDVGGGSDGGGGEN